MQIRPYEARDKDAVVRLSLRAWKPVFESIERLMSSAVFRSLHPDWRISQTVAVEAVCADDSIQVWVATVDDVVVGFVAVKANTTVLGELHMLAVDPEHQCRGVGKALTEFALARMKEAGFDVAMLETGGDPGHAPARRTYEHSGFELLPIARYFKKL